MDIREGCRSLSVVDPLGHTANKLVRGTLFRGRKTQHLGEEKRI